MKSFILLAIIFALGYLGIASGRESCPRHYYWSQFTRHCEECGCLGNGTTKLDCDRKTGQCDCKPGYIGRTCEQCNEEDGFHGNGDICCKREESVLGTGNDMYCFNCSCNPDGVKPNVREQCDRKGQCTCRRGYKGLKCFVEEVNAGARKLDLGNKRQGFAAMLTISCNGKCIIYYLRAMSDEGKVEIHGSDQPYEVSYVGNDLIVDTDGNEFCTDTEIDERTKECKIKNDDLVQDKFHVHIEGVTNTKKLTFEHKVGNYKRITGSFIV